MKNISFPKGSELNEYWEKKLIISTMHMVLSGTGKSKIFEALFEESPVKISNIKLEKIYQEAVKNFETEIDMEITISSHVAMYEEIYAWAIENGVPRLAAKTLKQKENLLGIHRRPSVKINKKTDYNIVKHVEYDTSLLSPEKKARLEFLLNKIKPEE